MHEAATRAELALLLEATATPTPGNVDRERDLSSLSLPQFVAGAAGAREGFEALAAGEPLGAGFESAIAGMADATGTNTQFGACLLLSPLVKAAATGECTPARAGEVIENSTVEDAVAFYRAFEHVDVRLASPPTGVPDASRGADAAEEIIDRGLTLPDVMKAGTSHDGIARELVGGFERTFEAAAVLAAWNGGSLERQIAATHLFLLGQEPDTLVVRAHDEAVAADVATQAATLSVDPRAETQRAREGLNGFDWDGVREFAADLVSSDINPGTTADILAGGIFIALTREAIQV